MMAASRQSSSSAIELGFLYAANTKGSVVEAYDETETGRKAENEDVPRVCARYDSKPLLNAKDPRGSAESASSRRK